MKSCPHKMHQSYQGRGVDVLGFWSFFRVFWVLGFWGLGFLGFWVSWPKFWVWLMSYMPWGNLLINHWRCLKFWQYTGKLQCLGNTLSYFMKCVTKIIAVPARSSMDAKTRAPRPELKCQCLRTGVLGFGFFFWGVLGFWVEHPKKPKIWVRVCKPKPTPLPWFLEIA